MYKYVVNVREKTYVWGSDTINTDLSWPLLLVINNDPIGDPVSLGSETADGGSADYGTLQPGQCWTIPLHGFRAVYAVCDTDTNLACSILIPHLQSA